MIAMTLPLSPLNDMYGISASGVLYWPISLHSSQAYYMMRLQNIAPTPTPTRFRMFYTITTKQLLMIEKIVYVVYVQC